MTLVCNVFAYQALFFCLIFQFSSYNSMSPLEKNLFLRKFQKMGTHYQSVTRAVFAILDFFKWTHSIKDIKAITQ